MNINLAQKYGILLSGGLDSAILLALLLKHYPSIKIQPFTIPKHDGCSLYVDNIIDYLNTKFSTSIPKTIYVGDPDIQRTLQTETAITEIIQKYQQDFLFMAVTKNFPELDVDIDLRATKRVLKPPRTKVKLLFPFARMYKDQVIKIMYEQGFEDLMNITHTCTDLQTTRCNVCWQCQERSFAFTKLGKIDTGTV